MSSAQLRKKIHSYIDQADDTVLSKVLSLMENHFQGESPIVAYTTKGEPLDQGQLLASVQTAIQSIENGKGLTPEEAKERINSWKRKKR